MIYHAAGVSHAKRILSLWICLRRIHKGYHSISYIIRDHRERISLKKVTFVGRQK